MSSPARADLWSHVDGQGVTHFAAERLDERYTLFFKGADLTRLDLMSGPIRLGAPGATTSGVGMRSGATTQPSVTLPKRFADLDRSKGYRAVHKHLQDAARTHAVDYELLKAVVAAESGFDASAVSPRGAVGLMQLMPSTAEQYGVRADAADRTDRQGNLLAAQSVEQKLTDPKTNLFAGARYLAYLIKLFKGDTQLAVAAYNAGEGSVQRAGNKIPNFKETQDYVKTVMGLYSAFKPARTQAVAQSSGGRPVASVVRRVGSRVRVELAAHSAGVRVGAGAPAPRMAAHSAPMPVLYTLPRGMPTLVAGIGGE